MYREVSIFFILSDTFRFMENGMTASLISSNGNSNFTCVNISRTAFRFNHQTHVMHVGMNSTFTSLMVCITTVTDFRFIPSSTN